MKNFIALVLTGVGLMVGSFTHGVDRDSDLSRTSLEKVLIVLTSHTELGDTGKSTGFWLPELTHPYYEFVEAGYTVDIASINGGSEPVDPKSFTEHDEFNDVFLSDAELMSIVIRSLPLASINPSEYRAVMFAGGSGPMWDFPGNKHISRISAGIYERDGIVSAVRHGNAALVDLRLTNGTLLVSERRIAAFTNEEETSLGTTEIVPFLLQDKLIERGAIHVYGEAWEENVIVDGRLVTGQNPASAKKAAQVVIAMLRGN